jgi:signal transduction histidine kinase
MVNNLVNDILDLAKMENASFKLDNDYFNLADTIKEALQMFQF